MGRDKARGKGGKGTRRGGKAKVGIAAAVVLVVAAVVAAVVLTRLSSPPASAEELLMRCMASGKADNFHADADIDLGVSALGLEARIPAKASFDVAGKRVHGTLTIEAEPLDYELEAYIESDEDGVTCHVGLPSGSGGKAWRRWFAPKEKGTETIDIRAVGALLSQAELTIIDGGPDDTTSYALAMPADEVVRAIVDATDLDERADIDVEKGGDLRVLFDRDCLPKSATAEAEASVDGDTAIRIVVGLDLDASVNVSKNGEVDPEKVAVPGEVERSAKDADEPISLTDVLGPAGLVAGMLG